ncbi:krab-a domain-containing protein, partial [Pseudoloma neurophilia]
LHKLTSEKTQFVWSDKEKRLFDEVKSRFSRHVELTIPDMNIPFILETDASEKGLGALLRQGNNPIAYASRVLNSSECNYGISEKEFLALIWGIQKFEYFLIGKPFTVFTDHQPLVAIHKKGKFATPKFERWLLKLQKYDFEIICSPPDLMCVPDILSRVCVGAEDDISKRYWRFMKMQIIVKGFTLRLD